MFTNLRVRGVERNRSDQIGIDLIALVTELGAQVAEKKSVGAYAHLTASPDVRIACDFS